MRKDLKNGTCAVKHATTNGQAVFGTAHISGRALQRMLRRSTASQKAVVGDDLRTGRLEVGPLTERQARRLSGASYGYIHIVGKLTDIERFAVCDGSRKLSEFAGRRREPTDAEVERYVQRIGVDRLVRLVGATLLAALDRHTAPKTNGNGHANDNDEMAAQMAFSL